MLATKRLASDDIAEAARLLRAGRLIAFPTETVYGLGADARDDRAVAQIFAAKARPSFNPLIVHLPSLEAVGRYADLPPELVRLAEVHWPGPLSLVAPARGGLSKLVTAGLPTVALRVPADPLARELLRAVDGPVAAPSANPSGRVSPTNADHVLSGLAGRIDAVLDGGPCGVGLESTIVGMEAGQPVLLRAGGIPTDALAETLGRPILPRQGDGVTAPGQLESHYAPRARLRLNAEAPRPGELWLGFGGGEERHTLSATGDLTEAAANLFRLLHELGDRAETIAVAPIPHEGLGVAINDRLTRAAAPR